MLYSSVALWGFEILKPIPSMYIRLSSKQVSPPMDKSLAMVIA